MSKFKVGDKVTGVNKHQVLFGVEDTIMDYKTVPGLSGYTLSDNFGIWHDYELKLVQPQTEFTFQEVIARNVPGIYVCTDKDLRIEHVVIKESGGVSIKANYSNLINSTLGIPKHTTFKLQEPKKQYTLVEVIHAVGGKRYTFRESWNPLGGLKPYEFVVCDTSMGKTFGRVAGSITKELTEKEYLEYKECWRAM